MTPKISTIASQGRGVQEDIFLFLHPPLSLLSSIFFPFHFPISSPSPFLLLLFIFPSTSPQGFSEDELQPPMESTWKWKCQLLSRVRLFATPWTVAHQAPLSLEFFRQEYWSRLPFQIFLTQGSDRVSCIAGGFLTIWATRQALSSPLFNDLESASLSSEFWLISELDDHSLCPSSQDFKAEGIYVASPFLIPLWVCLSFSKSGTGCLESHGLVGRLGIGFHGGWGMGGGQRCFYQQVDGT